MRFPTGYACITCIAGRTTASLVDYCLERGIEMRRLAVGLLTTWRTWISLRRRYPDCRFRRRHARATLAIARYVREARPDLLHTALREANDASILAGELTGRHVPVAVSIRNNVSMSAGYTGGGLSAAQALTPRADAVVAVSQGVAADAIRTLGLDARRVHAIYNATATRRYPAAGRRARDSPLVP